MHQVFFNAPTLRRAIYQVFGDMRGLRRAWRQRFGDALALRLELDQPFAMQDGLRLELLHKFGIFSEALRLELLQDWDIKDITALRREIYQVFGVQGSGEALSYTVAVTVDGVAVANPVQITIERDIDLYSIDCRLTVGGQAAWTVYTDNADVVLTIDAVDYHLVVVAPTRTRSHGAGTYIVELMSPACRLAQGFADPVSGELTGMASAIAAALAPGYTITWLIHDEYYAPGVLIAAEEYPIDIIRKLAAALRGVVQSNPDGSLTVMYRRPVHVPDRSTATVDHTLSDADDFYTAADTPERRPGYNNFTVSNQNAASGGLRMESVDISRTVKEVRGYQTPWTGAFDLTHTGGYWVQIEPLGPDGIETRSEAEVVEFVDGAGRTRYPVYAQSVVTWEPNNNLGTITFSEDGDLTSSVVGDSLLALTYQTKCKLWRVRNSRAEQLQLVADDEVA